MENILLTGGTGNLGKTVVKALSANFRHLHLSVRENIVSKEHNISYYKTDLTDPDQAGVFLQDVAFKNKHINAGVFLAGGFEPGDLASTGIETINEMIKLNFSTAFNISQKLIAHFRANGGGKLIFIGAKSAMDFSSAGGNIAYSLSKQLLFNFSKLINQSEKEYAISSHILLPSTMGKATQEDVSKGTDLTSPDSIAQANIDIIIGKDSRTVVEFTTKSESNQ